MYIETFTHIYTYRYSITKVRTLVEFVLQLNQGLLPKSHKSQKIQLPVFISVHTAKLHAEVTKVMVRVCFIESTIYSWVTDSLKQKVLDLCTYSETSLIRHSMGPENNVGLGDCWIMECLLPYLRMYGDCTSYNGRIRENVGL